MRNRSLIPAVVALALTMLACGLIDSGPSVTPLPDTEAYSICMNCVATHDGLLRMGVANHERDASGPSALLALWLDVDDDADSLYEEIRVHAGDVITYRDHHRVQVLDVNAAGVEVAVGEID